MSSVNRVRSITVPPVVQSGVKVDVEFEYEAQDEGLKITVSAAPATLVSVSPTSVPAPMGRDRISVGLTFTAKHDDHVECVVTAELAGSVARARTRVEP
ncbi:hypothetical protein predicted by Glimmer/Critica [Sorangium cellulosum So ce56]|uniref:Uncharacterized protein n=1 Tax=Sorangium cellulosum (strain So ce56) TaxID=448385 RepID=A9GJ65_SORC5|nr:hypothetical protein [Sorangium cellulosum]CAN93361.1 hypothetical protein predicted by Glimmer/Critica [Sorangium cellulosum So ce56]